ncbi:hypothetical protein [Romboutsia ilealis]|uniref:hypothetical protein n=1 Tax=Romboutsia ilealis TaxID=1115758 RepID=UPI00272A0DC4|nr:hypothetical protein [Romboutsia ilealis]
MKEKISIMFLKDEFKSIMGPDNKIYLLSDNIINVYKNINNDDIVIATELSFATGTDTIDFKNFTSTGLCIAGFVENINESYITMNTYDMEIVNNIFEKYMYLNKDGDVLLRKNIDKCIFHIGDYTKKTINVRIHRDEVLYHEDNYVEFYAENDDRLIIPTDNVEEFWINGLHEKIYLFKLKDDKNYKTINSLKELKDSDYFLVIENCYWHKSFITRSVKADCDKLMKLFGHRLKYDIEKNEYILIPKSMLDENIENVK